MNQFQASVPASAVPVQSCQAYFRFRDVALAVASSLHVLYQTKQFSQLFSRPAFPCCLDVTSSEMSLLAS